MSGDLSKLLDDRLRAMLYQSRQMLTSLVESLGNRPDMQNAVRRLMRADDMLETFSELAVKEPDLMRLVLQASVAALVRGTAMATINQWASAARMSLQCRS